MNIRIWKTSSAYAVLCVCAALALAGCAAAPVNTAAAEPDALFDAVVHGTAADVKAAIKAGADIDGTSDVYTAGVVSATDELYMEGATPLCFAIVQRDAEKAELLIDAGADLFAEDDDGWTPCTYAAAYGNLDTIKLLVQEDRRGFADWESDSGETPLHYAAGYNTADVVRYLLSLDAWDVNLLDDDGYSPADWAYMMDNYGARGEIERAGGKLCWYADDDSYADDAYAEDTPVFDAVVNGTAADVKAALDDFPDAVDGRSAKYEEVVCYDGDTVYMDGATPLCFAIVQQDTEKAELLIDAGADLFAEDDDGWGWTPCAYAAAFGNLDTVKLLVQEDRRGFADWESDSGETPLHYAAGYNTADVVRYLLSLDAWDVNLLDDDGFSPADWAYMTDNDEALGVLEQAGGKLCWYADDGAYADGAYAEDTPLFDAVVNGTAADVKAALDDFPDAVDGRSAKYEEAVCYDGDTVYMEGATPLCFAIVQRDAEKAELLIDAGADLFAEDDDGWTPCTYAAAYGNLDTIKLLVQEDRRGFADWESDSGETPLHYAAGYNTADVVRYLLSLDAWDVNLLDDDGFSPADWAYMTDNDEALGVLEQAGGKLCWYAE